MPFSTRLTRCAARIVSQIQGDKVGFLPIEILAQPKAKDAPNDALQKFLELYVSCGSVGALNKQKETGKLISDWENLLSASDSKPSTVEMSILISISMAPKDEEELVGDSVRVFLCH